MLMLPISYSQPWMPRHESCSYPSRVPLVISDTLGFIRDLPHTLVAAFRATLEETVQADLLLHVVDAGSPNRAEQIDEVNKVLKEIGADSIPQILVLNKIDLIDLSAGAAGYGRDEYGRIAQVRLSAKTGEGLEFIKLALSEAVVERALQGHEHAGQENSLADKQV